MSNKKTFEDNLKELEEVATKLETGNLGLDEAEKRINILVENENGDVIEEKFEVQ